ncbi:hypothetical protein GCM10010199_73790 [Dactylosporangium roseum]
MNRLAATGRRWSSRFAAVAGLLSVLAFAANASAYVPRLSLVSSDPAAETHVAHLPRQLELHFNETLIEGQVTLTDPSGAAVELGGLTVRNEMARVVVSVPDGAAGRYTVSYSTTSTAGRASHGSFSFTVTTGAKPGRSAGSKSPSADATRGPAETAAPVGTSVAAAPADLRTGPSADPGALLPEPKSGPPAWWTFAAVVLVVACLLVAFLGFSRRRIRPGTAPRTAPRVPPTSPVSDAN